MAIPETPTNPLITGETTTPGAYQSPLLTTLHGAADAPDGHPSRGVAWHYGNPLGEQRAFERSAGVVDRSHQRVLRITGDDALTWLNSLISQKVDALMPGMTTHGLILDAKGHIEHAVTIVRPRGDAPDTDDRQRPEESHAESGNQPLLYLICTPEHVDALRTYLTQMVFWSHVTVEDADVALITIMGPDTSAIINQITLEPHHWCHNTITFHDHVIGDNDSIHLLVPTAALKDTFTALTNAGATPTGLMAYEAERIKAVIPDVALDLDGRTVPHEVEAFIGPHASGPTQLATANEGPSASYVHLNKGCYRGQETVSRIHNLGRPPRLLVKLHIDGYSGHRPSPGDAITSGGRTVGRIGAVIDDCDEGPIALGLVKRAIVAKTLTNKTQVNSASDHSTPAPTAPPLEAQGIALAIDPDTTHLDDAPKAGRYAVDKLRGKAE